MVDQNKKNRFIELTQKAIKKYRENLLDISNRNNLINLNFNPRSNKILRIIDEIPNSVFQKLNSNKKLKLIPLPPSSDNPKDENTAEFKKVLEEEKLVNENYLKSIEELGESFDAENLDSLKIIRNLKDYVRIKLKLPKKPSKLTMSIQDYAKAHNIRPNFEVPKSSSETDYSKHQDNNLQTLFYPEDLERKGRTLRKDTKRILDEKGTNTLHLSFGCLEWFEAKDTSRNAPLLLLQVKLTENPTSKGPEYFIENTESELFTNLPLSKKLLNDFKIKLPDLKEEQTIEEYFDLIENEILKSKPDWKLRRYITLAIHTYSKMSMYEELDPKLWEKRGSSLGSQDAIKTLFTGSSSENSGSEIYDVDDKKNYSRVPILIEETDSSQFSTIVDSMNGENLAVQGPPGTGKSTTIANIIASFLFKKKKVLFVAEKKAALDVVYKKLADKDLDKFVFRLSSTAEKKTSIIEELQKRLDIKIPNIDKNHENDQTQYRLQISKIRKYGRILDTEYFEIKKTGYEILTNVAKYKSYLEKFPEYFEEEIFLKKANTLSKDKFLKNLSKMVDIKSIISKIKIKFDNIANHPWFGLTEEKNNPYELKDLRKTISKLNEESKVIKEKIKDYFISLNLKLELDEDNTKNIVNIFTKAKDTDNKKIKNSINYFDSIEKIEALKKFKIDLEKFNEFLIVKKQLAKEVDLEEVYKKSDLKKHLFLIENSIFIFSFLFNSSYRDSKNYFKFISKDGSYDKIRAISVLKNLISFVNLESNIQAEKNRLNKGYKLLEATITDIFKGSDTDLKLIKELVNIFVFDASENQILINKNFNDLKKIKKQTLTIEKILDDFRLIYSKFLPKISSEKFFNFKDDNILFDNIAKKVESIDLDDEETLSDYIQLNYYNNNLEEDVQKIYDGFVDENLNFQYIEDAYKYLVYNSLARELFEKERELSTYLSTSFENEVEKLRDLDRKIFKNQNKQLIENLGLMDITEGVSRGRASDLSEKALIEREITKKRAHIPFRQLMKRAGRALRDIKPCYMLSPISTSQIVSPEPEIFDVLIIDEASQMKIEDAIGSILRAKQVIIVGDPMQLPPTNFFNASSEFNTEDGIVDDDESILDLALSKFSSRMLRWHYRSKHESLINFSNYHFYNNNLIIPPSANDKFAISNKYLEKAMYSASTLKKKNAKESIGERGGVNIIEANEIADGVISFMKESVKKNIKRSCLVVTMNNSQRDLIDEEIRHRASKISEANTYIGMWDESMEPFTVKNLENVQGDERDYIFVSTLFGPNKEGITMQRFGPINHPKGHRRLNVLFTRAKQGLELYTSLTPNTVKEGGEKGRQIFKSYLDYAATQKIETGVNTNRNTDSDFEDWVKEELEKLGYKVTPQVGVSGFFIDLGIKHKSFKYGYLAGIECDGAAYHSSVSARDNDITRQKVLESMGWKIYRIWSTNWFDNPKIEIKKLDNYLKVLLKNIN
jgi:superfamily I DNA and/or RNA helicase